MPSSSALPTDTTSTSPLMLTQALTNLDRSVQQTVTSLYAFQTAFINASNASARTTSLKASPNAVPLTGPDSFDGLRACFHNLLQEISILLRKAHAWMDNPIILCQLMSKHLRGRPFENSELVGLGQLLFETYAQVVPIQEEAAVLIRHCEVLIEVFEQLARLPGVRDLLIKFRTNASKMKLNLGLDHDSEGFVRANLAVLYPDGITVLEETRTSLLEIHRASLDLNRFWTAVIEICRSLVQSYVSDPVMIPNATASSSHGESSLSSESVFISVVDSAGLESLRASMYDQATWVQHRKELSSSICSVAKMASVALVVPSGAPIPASPPAATSALVSKNRRWFASSFEDSREGENAWWHWDIKRVRKSRRIRMFSG